MSLALTGVVVSNAQVLFKVRTGCDEPVGRAGREVRESPWLMLHTTASSLGDAATASMAERGYADTARMIMHVDTILPKIVVEELGEDKALHPANVEEQTRRMMKNAWNREASTGL